MNASTALSLMRLMDQSAMPLDLAVLKGSVLTLQRNELLKRMRGDWILFIDDDMQWAPDAVARLVQTLEDLRDQGIEPDVLGALCFRRVSPYQPTLYVRAKGGGYNFLEEWDTDIVDIDATGMAFALITKACLERLVGGPIPPFEERIEVRAAPDFFKWYGSLGEDLRFCEEVKAAGGRVMVDTRVHIGHIGERVIGYQDFLRELAERPDEDYEARKQVNDTMGMPTVTRQAAIAKLEAVADGVEGD